MSAVSKYEPPREDGLKAFIVSTAGWGSTADSTIWAVDAKAARAKKRISLGRYDRIVGVKRKLATPE